MRSGLTGERSTIDNVAINAILLRLAMAQLIVRNLDQELVARLKRRAAEHGRSAEAEHREILRQALTDEPRRSFKELAARVRSMTAGRAQTPAEILQREGRDER